MKKTLGTRFTNKTGKNYLSFSLPSDVFLAEIYIKVIAETITGPIATHAQLWHYISNNDYSEDAAGNPAGNPLIVWQGWIKPTASMKSIRIPLNYLIDSEANGQFIIVFEMKTNYTCIFSADIIFHDYFTTSTANYLPADNQGRYRYTGQVKMTAVGNTSMVVYIEEGEYFDLIDYNLSFSATAAARDVTIQLGLFKPSYYSVVSGDYICLDRKFSGTRFNGPNDNLIFQFSNFPVDAIVQLRLSGFTRSAEELDIVKTGNCVLQNETDVIY